MQTSDVLFYIVLLYLIYIYIYSHFFCKEINNISQFSRFVKIHLHSGSYARALFHMLFLPSSLKGADEVTCFPRLLAKQFALQKLQAPSVEHICLQQYLFQNIIYHPIRVFCTKLALELEPLSLRNSARCLNTWLPDSPDSSAKNSRCLHFPSRVA